MGAINLGSKNTYSFGKDDVVIRHFGADIKGGKVLDVDGFADTVIQTGHIIIRTTDENETYKPLNVSGGKYVTLPEGHEYAGVALATVPVTEPFVGIMYNGEVNDVASPYPITAELKAALKTALPTLTFLHD